MSGADETFMQKVHTACVEFDANVFMLNEHAALIVSKQAQITQVETTHDGNKQFTDVAVEIAADPPSSYAPSP